jgi:large subunit ribosomal protein L20
MPRSVNSVASRNRRKKILKAAKGYFGRRKNVYTVAKNAVEKGMLYAYRDRKNNKRNFRSLWITRINAAARLNGMSYSQFMGKVKAQNIELNRKVLADLAVNNPAPLANKVGVTKDKAIELSATVVAVFSADCAKEIAASDLTVPKSTWYRRMSDN